jgi:hypothetical protein
MVDVMLAPEEAAVAAATEATRTVEQTPAIVADSKYDNRKREGKDFEMVGKDAWLRVGGIHLHISQEGCGTGRLVIRAYSGTAYDPLAEFHLSRTMEGNDGSR